MATVVATQTTFESATRLPKVLIVDANLLFANEMISQTKNIRQYHHLDTDVMRYDPTGKNGKTLAQIVAYARDPQHHIAMVLTGNRLGDQAYGAEIAKQLKHGDPVFEGSVAVQVMGAPDSIDILGVQHSGAIGVFDGGEQITKNFPKEDGTLERRANPRHPFTFLSDAYHHARLSGYQGKMLLPTLVVIDADANFCKIVNHQAMQCQLEYGMKVEALHYDAKGEQGLTGEQIIERIKDHPVDMVLTGNTYQQAPYGREIAYGIKQGEKPYKGLVAIQTADLPTEEDRKLALESGVVHVFNKDEPMLTEGKERNHLSAFAKIKAEYEQISQARGYHA